MSKAFVTSNSCPVCGSNVGSLDCTCDYPVYINALRGCKRHNAIMRDALERIAYQHCSPNEHIDYLAGIASESLKRTGGGNE